MKKDILRRSSHTNPDFFKTIVENALDGMQMIDLKGRVIYSNKAVEKICGYSAKEREGTNVNRIDADPRFFSKEILPSIMKRGFWCGELQAKHKDGHTFPAWLSASIVKGSRGKPAAITGIIHDITRRRNIEDALRENERRYRALFEGSIFSLWEEDLSEVKKFIDRLKAAGVKDLQAHFKNNPKDVEKCAKMVRLIDVNKATLDFYEARDKNGFINGVGKHFLRNPHGAFEEEIVAIAGGCSVFEFEAKTKTLAGKEKCILVRVSLVAGYEQSWSRLIVSFIDITDRKKFDDELKATKNLLEDVAEGITDGVFLLSLDRKILWANASASKLFHKPNEEIIGKRCFEVVYNRTRPCTPPDTPCAIAEVLRTNSAAITIHKSNGDDGAIHYTEVIVYPVKNKKGEIIHFVHTMRDITRRKTDEQNLLIFMNALDAAIDGIQLVDLDWRIGYSNKAVEDICGYSAGELHGKPADMINADPEIARNTIVPAIKAAGKWSGELQIKHKTGRIFSVWLSVSVVKDKDGTPVKMLNIIRDMTERKKIEEESKRRNEDLERFNKMAVGRELRMVELKKKISELESKVMGSK